jgi:peroxidase
MSIYEGYFKYQFSYGPHLDWLHLIEARESDGTGNNLDNDDWGSSHHAFRRITENSYGDGLGNVWDLPLQNNGTQGIPPNTDSPNPFLDRVGDMPRPRDVTDAIMAQPKDAFGNDLDIPSSAGISEYFQFFGQFLTHDVAEAVLVGAAKADGSVVQPDGPPLFLDGLPFPFQRTPDDDGDPTNVRNQENDETSYLDLSNVYGHSDKILNLLRERDGGGAFTAKMLTGATDDLLPTLQEIFDHHSPFDPTLKLNVPNNQFLDPPINSIPNPDWLAPDQNDVADILGGLPGGSPPDDFGAGDNRVNQTPHLASHHVLWLRNHNWHAEHLEAQYGGTWTQEQIFQAARALNEADWQNVVYNEYMTKLVGEDGLAAYTGYKDDVDATVINEWTSTAFRFGHDESRDVLDALAEDGAVLQTLTLGEAFAAGPDAARTDVDLNKWIRAQLAAFTQEIDGKVVDGNRNALFGIQPGGPGTPFLTVDLEVFDIQRGRDHGVGRYNHMREELFGPDARYDDFDDFAQDNSDLVHAATLEALKRLYNTGPLDANGVGTVDGIDRLDTIVGGLLEDKAPGSLLGETFTLLNVIQFEAFRDGDRHFYLNRFKDHPDLIKMIEATSLADIIERNTSIDHVYRDAFLAHTRKGGTDGDDTVNGTSGQDLLIGFKGNDKLHGQRGHDDIYGDDGNDQAWGGRGNDMLWGGTGNDRLWGEIGSDFLDGGDGADHLYGGTGDDFLFGGTGNDKLYGGRGRDYIDGGEGNDQIWGGAGRDTIAFGPKAGRDTVYDFAREDKLDLSALEFYSLQDVRDATRKTGGHTTIALDDHGASVRLHQVGWTLTAAQLILNDDAIV